MKLFPKIPQEVITLESYQKREMKIENIINRFRVGFLLVLLFIDILSFFLEHQHSFFNWEVHKSIFILIAAAPVLILIHYLSAPGKYYPWLKYITIALDLSVIFIIGWGAIINTTYIFQATNSEFTILMTIVFIFFSFLSVLRLNHNALLLSLVLSVAYNSGLYLLVENFFMMGLFTSLILIILHIFIFWVSSYILQYLLLSNKINSAYQDLKNAHDQITQKNEEISSQKEEISNHMLNLEQAYTELSDSIIYAKKIQNALINNSSALKKHFDDHFVFFKPKSIVSGDFFWVSKVGDKVMFALADCTGHGVPGAFMTMLGTSLLNEIINKSKITEPDKVLNLLRENIIEALNQSGKLYQPKDGMDMVLLQINETKKQIVFAGANNSFCYIPRVHSNDDGNIIEFKGDRMPVAYHYKMHEFSQLRMSYREGDQVYIFSDGYIDQFGGPKGKKFKSVPFKRMLYHNHEKSMEEQREVLEQTLNYWIKHKYEQIDDISVVGIRL